MYMTGKMDVEELFPQVGLAITPYDKKLRVETSLYDRGVIRSTHFNVYGPRKYFIADAMICNFNENYTFARFYATFIIRTNGKDIEYPADLKVVTNNQEIANNFTKTEDYIRLLYLLSNKKIDHVYINVKGEMTFPDHNPVIENVKVDIESRIIHEYFKDNPKKLNPCKYLEEKLAENSIIYEPKKMKDILTTFEMLKI